MIIGSNIIDFITIASTGNATDFGDLAETVHQDSNGCGVSNNVRQAFLQEVKTLKIQCKRSQLLQQVTY